MQETTKNDRIADKRSFRTASNKKKYSRYIQKDTKTFKKLQKSIYIIAANYREPIESAKSDKKMKETTGSYGK